MGIYFSRACYRLGIDSSLKKILGKISRLGNKKNAAAASIDCKIFFVWLRPFYFPWVLSSGGMYTYQSSINAVQDFLLSILSRACAYPIWQCSIPFLNEKHAMRSVPVHNMLITMLRVSYFFFSLSSNTSISSNVYLLHLQIWFCVLQCKHNQFSTFQYTTHHPILYLIRYASLFYSYQEWMAY